MKILRDILIGVISGLLVIAGICYVSPSSREILWGFAENLGVDATAWLKEKTEELEVTDFISLFSTSEEVEDTAEVADSGITGADQTVIPENNPYYGMLDENEQAVYKQMLANAEQVQESFKPVVSIGARELEEVFQAVFYDHPELFWLDTGYSYKYVESGEVVEIDLKYNETVYDLDNAKAAFNASAGAIIFEAMMYSSLWDMEVYVHDALAEMISYDLNASMNQSAYSALVNHSTVCAGYAKAFQYIMLQLGVPTYYVTGTSEDQDHAWNIVYIDGVYRNVDLTWDDTSGQWHRFLNLTDEALSQTHVRTGLSVYLPACY